MQGIAIEMLPSFTGELLLMVLADVIISGQQKATGATGRVTDGALRLGLHNIDNGLNQRAGGEVLTGPGLGILGVLLKQPLVDVGLDVNVQTYPGLAVDKLQQPAQFGRFLDFVLRLTEDGGDKTSPFAQFGEEMAVVALQCLIGFAHQALPVEVRRDDAGFAEKLRVLVIHLEKEQVGELFHVIAIGDAIVTQDVAVVPEALDDA